MKEGTVLNNKLHTAVTNSYKNTPTSFYNQINEEILDYTVLMLFYVCYLITFF